ncbi:MAG: fumarylacetoacetate hydrolase family protein [Rhodoferax sp.]|uniref:fumarylacetoacetate hydrolase family protein n=1 Tax=Rhodoferax sp. TaxID=50421 RepID=UPI002721E1D2|nr:fumarylacetoacetate hydrolase family protein [Rhodoferax sp.]MDO8451189.1 fumarylacetoacetate hydrolase family protein [Rhodoferax sp.]
MKFLRFTTASGPSLGVRQGDDVIDLGLAAPDLPRDLSVLLPLEADGLQAVRRALDRAPASSVKAYASLTLLTPIPRPEKIICIGLNYAEHIKEAPTPQVVPTYPVVFLRQAQSLIAHNEPLRRPLCSEQFDFEGELVCVIGRRGRKIPRDKALEYVGGYSLFNDASVRDYQFKSPQWTVGKNFDATGAFGPELVTADELPPGAHGLMLTTRLNGQVVQQASTADMIFDIATQISLMSEAMTLMPGDVIVTGTPSGVGIGRNPPLWMKHGDLCTVHVEGVGTLSNPVLDEVSSSR